MKKTAIILLFCTILTEISAQNTKPDQTPYSLTISEINKIEQKQQPVIIVSETFEFFDKNNSPEYLTLNDILIIDLSLLDIDDATRNTLKEILNERQQLINRHLSTKEIDEKISLFLSRRNIVKPQL